MAKYQTIYSPIKAEPIKIYELADTFFTWELRTKRIAEKECNANKANKKRLFKTTKYWGKSFDILQKTFAMPTLTGNHQFPLNLLCNVFIWIIKRIEKWHPEFKKEKAIESLPERITEFFYSLNPIITEIRRINPESRQ